MKGLIFVCDAERPNIKPTLCQYVLFAGQKQISNSGVYLEKILSGGGGAVFCTPPDTKK